MLNRFFRDNLNSLVSRETKPGQLGFLVPDAPEILEARGAGLPFTGGTQGFPSVAEASAAQRPPTLKSVRIEVIIAWSSIIITEEGAFEKPPNWPTDGNYPGAAYVLDTTVAFYEQKRVHLVTYQNETGSELTEDRFLLPLSAPYNGMGYTQGPFLYSSSGFAPVVQVDFVNGFGAAFAKVNDRLDELAGLFGNIVFNRL